MENNKNGYTSWILQESPSRSCSFPGNTIGCSHGFARDGYGQVTTNVSQECSGYFGDPYMSSHGNTVDFMDLWTYRFHLPCPSKRHKPLCAVCWVCVALSFGVYLLTDKIDMYRGVMWFLICVIFSFANILASQYIPKERRNEIC